MSEEFAQASLDASTNAYQQPVEKMLNQEQVNALIGREKAAAAEKARRETEERYRIELEKRNSQQYSDRESILSEAKRAAKEEMINELNAHKQKTFEENHRAQQEACATRYVEHLKNIQIDSDQDECGLISDPLKYSELVLLAGEFNFENTADIMKELAGNPRKLKEADDLAMRFDKALRKGDLREMDKCKLLLKTNFKRISSSVKNNKDALSNSPKINAPLTQIKPSSTGSGVERSKMTLAELKKQPWLQG